MTAKRIVAWATGVIACAVVLLEGLMRMLLLHGLFGFSGSTVKDPVVGRLPKPGIVVHEPFAGMFTIGEHSVRLNGNPPSPNGRRSSRSAIRSPSVRTSAIPIRGRRRSSGSSGPAS
jgi:hypothetical protein